MLQLMGLHSVVYTFDWYTQPYADPLPTSDSLCHGLHELKILDNIGDSIFVNYYITDSANYYNWYNPGTAQDTIYITDNNCNFDFSQPLDSFLITNQYFVSSFNGSHEFYHVDIIYYQGTNSYTFQDTVLMDTSLTNLIDFSVYCPTKSTPIIATFLFIDGPNSPLFVSELEPNNILNIFPNPSNGIIHINMSTDFSNSTIIELYNASMSKVAEYNPITVMNDGVIDATILAPGFYFIQISDSNFSSVCKIVIE